nr:LDCC motif putative metal-binding protein [uncultured Carboxylicivirga sp.]
MSEYSRKVKYKFNKLLSDDEALDLRIQLSGIEGIEAYSLTNEFLDIDFIIFKQSEKSLLQRIGRLGHPLQVYKSKKPGFFKNFINNLAKSNKESFGTKKLDCCDLKHD